MKTKFKDFLLYSMACIGAISLFLSAYQPQQITSTVPESHVWTDATPVGSFIILYNKQTGEARKLPLSSTEYSVYKENVPRKKK